MAKQTAEVQMSLKVEEALETDQSWSGITCDGVAGEILTFNQLCYRKSDGKWWKTSSNTSETTDGHLALATESLDAEAEGIFLLMGYLRDDSWGWTRGESLYIHTTPGEMVQVAPSGSGKQVRKLGAARSASIVWFSPGSTILEVA